jgi:hypothetical protein
VNQDSPTSSTRKLREEGRGFLRLLADPDRIPEVPEVLLT